MLHALNVLTPQIFEVLAFFLKKLFLPFFFLIQAIFLAFLLWSVLPCFTLIYDDRLKLVIFSYLLFIIPYKIQRMRSPHLVLPVRWYTMLFNLLQASSLITMCYFCFTANILKYFCVIRWSPYLHTSLFLSVCPSICPPVGRIPYLRNNTSWGHNFLYTCVKWWYLQLLFLLFGNFDFSRS